MKTTVYFITLSFLLSACGNPPIAQNPLEYRVDEQTYVIVVPLENGTSDAEARQEALKRAAEIAEGEGYQYITIEKEQKVTIVAAKRPPSNQGVPKNLYEQQTQPQNFGQDRPLGNPIPSSSPAYKVVFKCYKDKPKTSKTIINVSSL